MNRLLFTLIKMSEHDSIFEKLHSFHISNRIPNIIFSGSLGSGKQHILSRFLKMIYINEQQIRDNVMFVNCAQGKGIKFIREELKFFAKTNVNIGVAFKSIVLLYAEHLTVDAQSALRRCIEQFSHHTRFFVLIENKNNLLTPILSRFCEIYVPDVFDDQCKVVNQSTNELDKMFPSRNQRRNEINKSLDQYLHIYISSTTFTHNDMITTVDLLYENAFSAQQIVDWVGSRSEWNEFEKANIGMCYTKIKSEFRNEKLLMLFMLDFICYSATLDIKYLSFM